jgi:hypothetical protein
MSKQLSIAAALSVLMMSSFALLGPNAARSGLNLNAPEIPLNVSTRLLSNIGFHLPGKR